MSAISHLHPRHARRRAARAARSALALLVAAVLVAPVAVASTVTGSSGAVAATMHAGTHHPKVNRLWPIQITATSHGRAASGSVLYEYLFGGKVVATRNPSPTGHFRGGRFTDTLQFPARAVGYPLTFRAVVTVGHTKVNLDYAVQVVK